MNIMLDIETISSKPGACLVSIGAATFSSDGADQDRCFVPRLKFYVAVDPQSAQDAGGCITARTVQWWAKQSDAARAALNDPNAVGVDEALRRFAIFCQSVDAPAACSTASSIRSSRHLFRNNFWRTCSPRRSRPRFNNSRRRHETHA